METNQTPATQAGTRPELPPTKVVYFDQEKGQPAIERVIFALKGVCEAMDQEQLQSARAWFDNGAQMNRMANMATAAEILADQLYHRLTSRPNRARRRKPTLRAVAAGAPEGAA